MRLRLTKEILFALIAIFLIITGALALTLRDSFRPTELIQGLDVSKDQLRNLYSYSSTANLSLPTDQFQVISKSSDISNLSVSGNEVLGRIGSSQLSGFTMSTRVLINITKFPLFAIVVETSPIFSSAGGFGYGIRFEGILPNGRPVELENDAWSNEHVRSGGQRQITVYLPNYGFSNLNITNIQVYGEERPGVISSVQMKIISITIYNVEDKLGCSGAELCFLRITGVNGSYFDSLNANLTATGNNLSYRIIFPFNNVLYGSSLYYAGNGYVSILSPRILSANSWSNQNFVPLANSGLTLFVSAQTGEIDSISFRSVRITFTSSPTVTRLQPIPANYLMLTFLAEIILGFALPIVAIVLLLRRVSWKLVFAIGLFSRIALMPWTSHPDDTVLWIRASYLYYHLGWAPTFYNPPTYYAYALPIGAMSYYYLLGLDKIDVAFLFHFGGIIATTVVKLPFLLLDIGNMFLLFSICPNRKLFGLVYFLNPYTIFVISMWGSYESLTLFGLLMGYKLIGQRGYKEIAGLLGFLIAGLSELFGFLVLPFYGFFLLIQKRLKDFLILVSGLAIVLVFVSSIRNFLISLLSLRNDEFQPNIYTTVNTLSPGNQLPLIVSFLAAFIVATYLVLRNHDSHSSAVDGFNRSFRLSVFFVIGVMISGILFGASHPQWPVLIIGLLSLYFATLDDLWSALFLLGFGTILAITTIVSAQSFAYLLTGEVYFMFPQIEGGNHLVFFAFSSLILYSILLLRTRMRSMPVSGTLLASAVLVISVYFWTNFL